MKETETDERDEGHYCFHRLMSLLSSINVACILIHQNYFQIVFRITNIEEKQLNVILETQCK